MEKPCVVNIFQWIDGDWVLIGATEPKENLSKAREYINMMKRMITLSEHSRFAIHIRNGLVAINLDNPVKFIIYEKD